MHNNWVISSFTLTLCDTLHIPYEVRVTELRWFGYAGELARTAGFLLSSSALAKHLAADRPERKSSSGQGCTYHSVLHFKTLIKCNTVVLKLKTVFVLENSRVQAENTKPCRCTANVSEIVYKWLVLLAITSYLKKSIKKEKRNPGNKKKIQ